jgi:hypothetical protein
MRAWFLSLAFLGLVACAPSSEQEQVDTEISAPRVAEGEPIRVESALGPVTTTVVVTPKSPLIGDIMSLTLTVEAKDGVELTMPKSREAFSRFEITDEDQGREAIDGGERHTQSYKIQTSSSGRLRIPPMRLVFVDTRPGEEASGEERELLTEEIAILVRPVLSGEEATDATLRPIRRPLEEHLGPSLWQRYWWAFLGGPLLLATLVAGLIWRRGRKAVQISPYERASVALSELEAGGLPDEEARDYWYVELSSIVRRYLEDRFALRAPELTTEEFLRVAQRSVLISSEHKALLSSFLADCDQVKFAGYAPGEEESRSVLAAARRFLLETRVLDSEQWATKDSDDSASDAPTESEAA